MLESWIDPHKFTIGDITVIPLRRLFYVDNLRVALTALVIIHHVGQAFGGTGGWWYYQDAVRSPALSVLFTLDRSFFMSLFFLISGYFLPASFERKGARLFIKDRLVRLGVPILFFFLLVIPLMMYFYYVNFRGYGSPSFLVYYLNVYFGAGGKPAGWSGPSWPDMQFGHTWFLEHLLFFALCYTLIRLVWKRPVAWLGSSTRLPGNLAIILFALLLSGVTFTVRIWYPIDKWIGFLGLIQTAFADVPRDLSFFILGIAAYRTGWLERVTVCQGKTWLAVGLGLGAAYALLTPIRGSIFNTGGPDWKSWIFAVWESLYCCGMVIGLLVLFREKLNVQPAWLKYAGTAAFTAYLFHVPVVVALQYEVGGLVIGPLVKFGLVSLVAVPLTFVISHYLRQLPVAKEIL
jgi:glucans biosynthesis protein C